MVRGTVGQVRFSSQKAKLEHARHIIQIGIYTFSIDSQPFVTDQISRALKIVRDLNSD